MKWLERMRLLLSVNPYSPRTHTGLIKLFYEDHLQLRRPEEMIALHFEHNGQFDFWLGRQYQLATLRLNDIEAYLSMTADIECPDCGHPLSRHVDHYGCQYDRGDQYVNCRDGGTILAAVGPCGCTIQNKEY